MYFTIHKNGDYDRTENRGLKGHKDTRSHTLHNDVIFYIQTVLYIYTFCSFLPFCFYTLKYYII